MVLDEITHQLSNNNKMIGSLTIVVDNPVRPTISATESAPPCPPMRHLRKMELKKLNASRNKLKKQRLLDQSQLASSQSSDDENEHVRPMSPTPSPLDLSPPSRWESIPHDTMNNTMKQSHSTPQMPGKYGKETFTALPRSWSIPPPTAISIRDLKKSFAKDETRSMPILSVPLFRIDDDKLSLIRQAPGRRQSHSAPVRMPVRKNSFDSQPRKPIRSSGSSIASRNATISILDEALSVCNLCGDDTDPMEALQKDIPVLPSLKTCY